jgi:hypothetical protein
VVVVSEHVCAPGCPSAAALLDADERAAALEAALRLRVARDHPTVPVADVLAALGGDQQALRTIWLAGAHMQQAVHDGATSASRDGG